MGRNPCTTLPHGQCRQPAQAVRNQVRHRLDVRASVVNQHDSPSINTGTTPDEVGCKFQVPAAMTCYGARECFTTTWTTARPPRLTWCYTTAANGVLASASPRPTKIMLTTSTSINMSWDAVSLAAATNYRLIIKPTTAGLYTFKNRRFESTAALVAIPEGVNWQWTQRTDAGRGRTPARQCARWGYTSPTSRSASLAAAGAGSMHTLGSTSQGQRRNGLGLALSPSTAQAT